MSQNPGVGAQSGEIIPVSTKTPLTASSPTTATVTSSSATIVAANSNRKGLVIINIDGKPVSLAFGSNPAVLNSGITLTTNGSVFEEDEYIYVTSAVQAISTGSNVVSIQEYT